MAAAIFHSPSVIRRGLHRVGADRRPGQAPQDTTDASHRSAKGLH